MHISTSIVFIMLDEELPQMSNKQWSDTYRTKLTQNISPAIIDMIGSVRSKIYSIRKIIERDQKRYQHAKEHYKILCADLSMEDRVSVAKQILLIAHFVTHVHIFSDYNI